MKKDELIAIGLTEDQAKKVLDINGGDIEHAKAAKDKAIGDLTAERDSLQARLTTAETTLKGFEGIDPEKMQGEIETYKKRAEDAEADFQRQITQRDQRDWITKKLDEYGVKSPFARKQLIADAMAEDSGLSWKTSDDGKSGSFYGFDDYMKAAKAQDASLYETAEEKAAAEKAAQQQEKAPKFTGPVGNDGTEKKGAFTPPKIF